jgi:lipopolysaccharide biosynthesis glycosyltransferase
VRPGAFDFDREIASAHWSAHYSRLLISRLLPAALKKVIYLDADTLVLHDIERLWETPLEGHVVAAATDYLANVGAAISNYRELGLDPDEKYFNSGVMLINVDLWRQHQVGERVLACTQRNRRYLDAQGSFHQYDQFGLNVVLYRHWKELDGRWNYGSELQAADAFIVHYNGHGKPWSATCSQLYRDLFFEHLREGGWAPLYEALFAGR